VNEKFELYNVPIAGGVPVKLNGTLPSQGDVTSAEFTPDGTKVIFLADENGDNTVELFSVPGSGGTPTKISGPLVNGGDVTDFQISPDGQRVIYRADEDADEVFELYSVSLSSAGAIPGDFNHNGIVDAADYTVWRDSFGKTGPSLAADSDGNNSIDMADYNTWKSNFGRTSGSGSSSDAVSAVPEPRGDALLWVGSLLLIVLCVHCDIIASANSEQCGCEVIGQHVELASNHRRGNGRSRRRGGGQPV